jgi:hypothetical protein
MYIHIVTIGVGHPFSFQMFDAFLVFSYHTLSSK